MTLQSYLKTNKITGKIKLLIYEKYNNPVVVDDYRYMESKDFSNYAEVLKAIRESLTIVCATECKGNEEKTLSCTCTDFIKEYANDIAQIAAEHSKEYNVELHQVPGQTLDFLLYTFQGRYDPKFYEHFATVIRKKKSKEEESAANVGLSGIQLAFGALLKKHRATFGEEETKKLLKDCKWPDEMINKIIK